MRVGLDPARRCTADLAITGRSAEDHAARALLAGTWLAALVLLVGSTLGTAGARLHADAVLAAAVVAFLAGPVIAEVALRSEANGRREDLRVDLGSFAELMVLLLAAGSGVEGALAHAAEAGDDWTWLHLRDALRAARLTRRSPAEALCSLGRQLGVTELEELGAAVDLAASSGTRLRASLTARAEALRARELARTQAQAASATERMTFPVVALALGFLVVLGYPALSKVLTSF
jgi:Flp pilus assembly protein TadB